MNNIVTENRRELLRQVRTQKHAKNVVSSTGHSSFQLRFLVAVILLSCAILIDKSGINLAGITTETIVRVISADYEEHLEEWIATIAQ